MAEYKKEDIHMLYYDKKMSTTEIAPLVGMSQSGISYYLRSHGYKPRDRGLANSMAKRTYGNQRKDIAEDERKEIVRLYVDEMQSTGQIGKKYNLKHGSIRSILNTRGIKLRSPKEGVHIRFPGGRWGENTANWKGGRRRVGKKGSYIGVYSPDHPTKNRDGYVMEHRLVMEKHLGRYLTKEEIVHHKNGVKHDNRLENLELVESQGIHTKEHFERSHITEKVELESTRLRQLLIDNGINPDPIS